MRSRRHARRVLRVAAAGARAQRIPAAEYSLHDFLAVERFTIGAKDVVLFAAHAIGARHTNPRVHLAVVCTHQGIVELGNLFAGLTRLHLEFFARVEDTTAWVEAALEED